MFQPRIRLSNQSIHNRLKINQYISIMGLTNRFSITLKLKFPTPGKSSLTIQQFSKLTFRNIAHTIEHSQLLSELPHDDNTQCPHFLLPTATR